MDFENKLAQLEALDMASWVQWYQDFIDGAI